MKYLVFVLVALFSSCSPVTGIVVGKIYEPEHRFVQTIPTRKNHAYTIVTYDDADYVLILKGKDGKNFKAYVPASLYAAKDSGDYVNCQIGCSLYDDVDITQTKEN